MLRHLLLTFLLTMSPMVGICMPNSQLKEYKLDNGLRIVVRPDHRAPVVVTQIWYRVGSADEHGGITGISHALEHMMFLGTEKVPLEAFSKRIGKLGGYENAFTSEDQTVYYEEIGKQHLAECLLLEADRMINLQFNSDQVKRELEVIKEERRMRVEDDPQSLTWERFMAAANVGGAYHHPVIGWMEDIERYTVEDLKAWYAKWYAPNNATLVVVGDVEPDEVYHLSQQYFSHIPASETISTKQKPEVKSLGLRQVEVNAKAELPFLMMGFDVPTFAKAEETKNVYALMVLQSVLDGGLSARFETELVRKQAVAAEIGIHYDPHQRYQNQMIIYGTPSEGKQTRDLIKAVEKQIDSIKREKLTKKELTRAKMNIIASFIYGKDSIRKQAMQIGSIATLGLGMEVLENFEANIQAVTEKEVQAAAQRYLIPQRQTIATLVPQAAA